MKTLFYAILLILVASVSSILSGPIDGDDELSSLSGIFYHSVKSLNPFYIELDGGAGRFGLRGRALDKLKDGTRILVRGEIRTHLYDNMSDPTPATMPMQWVIYMEVKEVKIIDRPFGNLIKKQDCPLQLTIKSDKDVYEVGEKISVLVGFKNISKAKIEVLIQPMNGGIGCGENMGIRTPTQVSITDSEGNQIDFSNAPIKAAMLRKKKIILEPNTTYSNRIYPKYGMKQPGVYLILINQKYDNKIITSNSIAIGVSEKPSNTLKLTIEPVNAEMEEYGVYIFRRNEPFKIKVILENQSDKELSLLTPSSQNHGNKVFYFQILDMNGTIIETDIRKVHMHRNETLCPEKIQVLPKKSHSFFAYINSYEYGMEHHHFATNLTRQFSGESFDKRYYRIRGIYDTTGYGDIFKVHEIILHSNGITIEIVG